MPKKRNQPMANMNKLQNKKVKHSFDGEEKIFNFLKVTDKEENKENENVWKEENIWEDASQTTSATLNEYFNSKGSETSWASQVEESELSLNKHKASFSLEKQETCNILTEATTNTS